MAYVPARFLLLLGAFLALITSITPAKADEFTAADFMLLNGQAATSYEFMVSIPEGLDIPEEPIFPESCKQVGMTRNLNGTQLQMRYELRCPSGLSETDTIQTPWKVDGASYFANVSGMQVSRSLNGSANGVLIPIGGGEIGPRPFGEIFREYIVQGVLHIWMGWDHLAFVLCLCMLTLGRRLLYLVTAFTIGHSLSLALAFFEVVTVPILPVEAIIALSIAFMAREALVAPRDAAATEADKTLRFKRQMLIVIGFGLLHGLGFASALGDLGVQASERIPALIVFNLGVEFGQLAFVAAIGGLMAILRKISLERPLEIAAMAFVGILGSFWTIERIVGFLQA